MNDRLAIVVAGDDDMLHLIEVLSGSTSPSAWVLLGAPSGERLAQPTLIHNSDQDLELFAFSTSHLGMWRRRRMAPLREWDDWVRQPDPPAVTWDEAILAVHEGHGGKLHMFCVNGSDRKPPLAQPRNQVWHRYEKPGVHGKWSKWQRLGQPPNAEEISPTLVMNCDGRLELIAGIHTPLPDERFEMWRLHQEPHHGKWSTWERAIDPTDPSQRYGPRAVCRGADGRLLAFGTLFDSGDVGQTVQGAPGGNWQPWTSLGKPDGLPASALGAVVEPVGRANVFALASDKPWEDPHHVWHLQQAGPDGIWSSWSHLGAPPPGIGSSGDELVAHASAGGLHIFAVAMDGALWSRGLPANGGQWSPWQSMGKPASTTQVFSPTLCQSA